jgi:arginine/ornithine transport system permease protein
MLHRANMAASSTREPFTFFMLIAVLCLAITTVSIVLVRQPEKRFSLGLKVVRF